MNGIDSLSGVNCYATYFMGKEKYLVLIFFENVIHTANRKAYLGEYIKIPEGQHQNVGYWLTVVRRPQNIKKI